MTDEERQVVLEVARALMDHAADCEACQRLLDRLAEFGVEL